jgi:16S rRNA C967 or C1407 C5-methylase (RsmB/RsmF family)
LIFDSTVAAQDAETKGNRKRKNKSARARERKRLQQIVSSVIVSKADGNDEKGEADVGGDGTSSVTPSPVPTQDLFDHVLVDAECSTDGSLKHLRERLKDGADLGSNLLLTDESRLADLVNLQCRLLATGLRLLKSGGTLVYSTCSLSQSQNETVVTSLLKDHADAYVIPVEFSLAKSKLVAEGSLQGTIRFYPNIGQQDDALFGDGFFLAKIGKR